MSGQPMRHPAARAEPFRLFANRQTALLAAIYDSIAHRSRLAGEVARRGWVPPVSAIHRLPRVREKSERIAGLLLVNAACAGADRRAARFSPSRPIWRNHHHRQRRVQAVNIAPS